MSPLEVAILLRQQVRAALDRGDDAETRRLNRLADAAYLKLDAFEAEAYRAWAFAPERAAGFTDEMRLALSDDAQGKGE